MGDTGITPIPNWLLEEKRLSVYERFVLSVLIQFSNGDKTEVSQSWLADRYGIDRKTVRIALQRLTDLKLIVPVKKGTPGKATTYKLPFKWWGKVPRFVGWVDE